MKSQLVEDLRLFWEKKEKCFAGENHSVLQTPNLLLFTSFNEIYFTIITQGLVCETSITAYETYYICEPLSQEGENKPLWNVYGS